MSPSFSPSADVSSTLACVEVCEVDEWALDWAGDLGVVDFGKRSAESSKCDEMCVVDCVAGGF